MTQRDPTSSAGPISLEGLVAVVTGGAQGIGRALVEELAKGGVEEVVVFDQEHSDAYEIATGDSVKRGRVSYLRGDVRCRESIEKLVQTTEKKFGRIDLFVSNAGVMRNGGVDSPESVWREAWEVNVMAHVWAAQSALPGMLERGSGTFLNVTSAAGLLTAPGAAPYAVTKHAAQGFAEWLAVTYAHRGIKVTTLCPEAVDTAMLRGSSTKGNTGVEKIASQGVLSADSIAKTAIQSVQKGEFLATTHPHTLRNTQKKWADVGRWIEAMNLYLSPEGKN